MQSARPDFTNASESVRSCVRLVLLCQLTAGSRVLSASKQPPAQRLIAPPAIESGVTETDLLNQRLDTAYEPIRNNVSQVTGFTVSRQASGARSGGGFLDGAFGAAC